VWSSLRWWGKGQKNRPAFMDDGPVDRPKGWVEEVNRPMTDEELEQLRRSVNRVRRRARRYGRAEWRSDWALRHRSVPRSTEKGQGE